MAGSTLKILEIMGSIQETKSREHSSVNEPAALDAPQLKPSLNMGNKLEEILKSSLTNQHNPMSK